MKGIVRCEPYNPKWKEEFIKIRSMLDACIGDLIIGFEHVGSTSVEGLAAKPIIDIDVVIDSYEIFPQIVERLMAIGFIHEGDGGIKGREVFKRNFEDDFMPYHLYVCPKNSEELLRHIAFREYLKGHASEREEYGSLKMRLAEQFPTSIDKYMSGKHDCVQRILLKIRSESAIPSIYTKPESD